MTADALLASLGIASTTGGPIFKFSCACGHTWQGRKASAGAYFERFASSCSGCGSVVTEAMEAAAEPLGLERCDCGEPFVDGRCSVCVPSSAEAKARRTAVDAAISAEFAAAQSCFCGKAHRPVAAYGAWCCPDRLSGARFGDLHASEVADSREIDKLRDLRALVLRTGHPTGKAWAAIIAAARAAITPEGELITGADGTTMKVTDGTAKWRSLGLSITTTLPTEEHECSSCHMVTHARVGMGPPATCPGCGR